MERVILIQENKALKFPELYQMYSLDLYRYSLSILKDEDDAKDAVQETFIRYIENEKTFQGNCSQKTWLLVIARNYCFSRLKRADRNNEQINEDTFDAVYELKIDERITLEDALKQLSAKQNELLFLKEHAGYSYAEIGEITNDTLDNVKIKLFRTRQKLKRILKGSF